METLTCQITFTELSHPATNEVTELFKTKHHLETNTLESNCINYVTVSVVQTCDMDMCKYSIIGAHGMI
jgi:hypothetical protein